MAVAVERAAGTAPQSAACRMVEFRQYTLHPHQRDVLIDLFDREFVEPLEVAGMCVIGQFRDLDDPDRFTWMRGFADMAARKRALEAFYDGPIWAAQREAANATMIDSDNVLLLRPAWSGSTSGITGGARAERGAHRIPAGLIDATIFYLRKPAQREILSYCHGPASDALAACGALESAWYVTEPGANDFPRLPVREGECVLLRLAVFPNAQAHQSYESGARSREIDAELLRWVTKAPERHRLTPTARSAVHAERNKS